MIIIKLKTKKKMPCYISFHLQNSYDSYVNIFFLMYAHNVNGISFYELSFHIIIILLIIIITIIMITIITIIIIIIMLTPEVRSYNRKWSTFAKLMKNHKHLMVLLPL